MTMLRGGGLCIALALAAGCGKGSEADDDDTPERATPAIDARAGAATSTPDRLPATYADYYALPASPAAAVTDAQLYVLVTTDRIGAAAVPAPGVKTPLGGGLPGKPIRIEDIGRQIDAYARGRELIGNDDELVEPAALDEGMMGKPESERAPGVYEMKPPDDVGWGSITGSPYGGGGLRHPRMLSSAPASDNAPLVLADADLPALRLVEVVYRLCTWGGRVGVTRQGSPDAAEHPVWLMTLRSYECTGGTAGVGAQYGDDIIRVQLGTDGLHRIEDTGRTALSADQLVELIEQAGATVAMWLLLDPGPSVADLVAVLDTIAGTDLEVAHVATMSDWREHYVPPNAPVPQVVQGDPTVTGDLDKTIIRRYVRRKVSRIKLCYGEALTADPTLKGTVTATFTIGAQGNVLASSATGLTDAVSVCVADVIASIGFPKPKGGGAVEVRYPLTFRTQ